jgi:putative ABC transport system permease protein
MKGPGPSTKFIAVVGVVGTVRMTGLTESDPVGAYYLPAAQAVPHYMTLVVKAAADPSALTPSIRRELAAIDPELPFYNVKPMRQRVDESLTSRRTPMALAVTFGLVALFLAAVGIYGVLAYQVTQRRREIGIRIALGSDAGGIFGLVLREGVVLLALGLVIGLAGAFALRRAMETQLFRVSSMDPTVIAATVVVLGTIGLAACAIPARRAARTDPVLALND